MAPEILQFHKYDAKADLWSVGTILFELVVGARACRVTGTTCHKTQVACKASMLLELPCQSENATLDATEVNGRLALSYLKGRHAANCACDAPPACAGKPPFTGANHVQLLRNIERAEAALPAPVAAALSPSCRALLHGLLRRNPLERISFEEFFSHAFLAGGGAGPSGGAAAGEGLRGPGEGVAAAAPACGAHAGGLRGVEDGAAAAAIRLA